MPTVSKSPFQPVDAMVARAQFGDLLDRVDLTKQRFLIRRRGKPRALLVPLEDSPFIETGLRDASAELETVYNAFEQVKGIIDDPAMRDASSTIDEWVYGAQRKEGREG